MLIRHATMDDLKAISELESLAFPPGTACEEESFRQRLTHYPSHFWLVFDTLESDLTLVSFSDGLVTDACDLTDEMYDRADMHNEAGAWQMIFGLVTHPQYRQRGYATAALTAAISQAKKEARQGLVLTCKEALIHYYAKFGFINEGRSVSTHGDTVWYQMRLTF